MYGDFVLIERSGKVERAQFVNVLRPRLRKGYAEAKRQTI